MFHDELDRFLRLRRWFLSSCFSVIPDHSILPGICSKEGVQFFQRYFRPVSLNLARFQH